MAARRQGRLPVEVVVQIRWTADDACRAGELAEQLRDLSPLVLGITVVDGSAPCARERHERAFRDHARVLAPAPVGQLRPRQGWVGRNGKVVGAYTGVLAPRSDLVVIADDDVRHTETTLLSLLGALVRADLVRPVTVYDTWPWQARWDGARTLLNLALAADWPGTMAVRRDAVVAAGGWCPDVLFENLELWRTLEARGRRVATASLVIGRRPPSVRHFWSQRVRQAYDDFAQPGRLAVSSPCSPAWSCSQVVDLRAWSRPRSPAGSPVGSLTAGCVCRGARTRCAHSVAPPHSSHNGETAGLCRRTGPSMWTVHSTWTGRSTSQAPWAATSHSRPEPLADGSDSRRRRSASSGATPMSTA